MIEWWQHIPEQISPIVFTVGFFSVRWYALCWLMGFFISLLCAWYFGKKLGSPLSKEVLFDLFLVLFLWAFIGGHLGYAFLYRPDIFLADPIGFFLPYDTATGVWSGISGMSFYGGLTGVILALFFFVRKRQMDFLSIADLVALSTPPALLFGRLGNFLTLELYGRVTTSPFGMYFLDFYGEKTLRHPSALYEALGEGVFLFSFLIFVRRFTSVPGRISAWFFMGYGVIRFFLEYVREPDQGLALVFGILTRAQIFSLLLVASGIWLYVWFGSRNHAKIAL